MSHTPTKYSISENFNAYALEKENADVTNLPYVRGADALANLKRQVISFYHVPSKTEIYFKAFVTNFQETYNSDWASETVYGRADPIYLFKNTTRKISLGFKVPAASASEAYENLGRVQKLIQSLYPNYTTLTDPLTGDPDVFAQTISQSPMVRLKIMNLIQDQQDGYSADASEEASDNNTYEKIVTDADGISTHASAGLLGVIDNVTVDHHVQDAESGVFTPGQGVLLPKLIEINLAFSPIHEHPVGWRENPDTEDMIDPFFNSLFPYGINLEGSLDSPNAAPASYAGPTVSPFAVENLEEEGTGEGNGDLEEPGSTSSEDSAAATGAQAAQGLGLSNLTPATTSSTTSIEGGVMTVSTETPIEGDPYGGTITTTTTTVL